MRSVVCFADVIISKNPGSVKMVCSSVVLGLILWSVLQFGSQSAMMAAIEMSSAVKVPVISIQSYINSYSDWSAGERWKRAIRKLPPIDNREIEMTVNFAQSLVNKMSRHEMNIVGSNVKVLSDSPGHGQLIESLPSPEAFQYHRDAMIALKASQYLSSKHCIRLGIDDESCAKQVATIPMTPTSLGTKCAVDNGITLQCPELSQYRSSDGSCNHKKHPAWGRSLTAYNRLLTPEYEDGFQKIRGSHWGNKIVSPRSVSVALTDDLDSPDTSKTLAIMQWGQFIANDMSHTVVSRMLNTESTISCCSPDGKDLSPRHLHPACAPIDISSNDPFYSKFHHTCMSYVRSMAAMRPDCKFGPLEQMNQATHYLDGSTIYGSTPEVAQSLRSFWQGRLRTETRDNKEFLPIAKEPGLVCVPNTTCYDSGDVRVNMIPGLTALHTLWLREHNRLAQRLIVLNPHWNDERIYQEARKIVTAQIQHITYNEWLPVILGLKFVRRHSGLTPEKNGFSRRYNVKVDPSVSNSFATAASRFISSMVEGRLGLYQEDRNPEVTILLKDHFNKPNLLESDGYLDSLVRGMATQSCQRMDLAYSDAMIKFLHKNEKYQYGMDQLSLDLQRGRDHGLPGYNKFRKFCGLKEAIDFDDFSDTINVETIAKLKKLYRNVDEIDLLIGGLAENHEESLVGPTFQCIIAEQFTRTRSGDKFFYDNGGLSNSFTPAQLHEIKKATLARVFCDNSDNVLNMQPFVFHKPASPNNDLVPCGEVTLIQRMDLEPWREEPIRSSKLH
ncbi:salivary peroxidase/catechol oxidase-like isoform X2 [Lycorma delicatula]|uniref:salivary peroxidase/catechol oxidase-like isoform X2 n=1 Tax=Lycorma delicatula TaxID=130591 RepID=UPI003F50FAA1